jgi:hypothetical protein
MTAKLRLGPLPKTETVKLTITLPIHLREHLDRYAELHAQTWGEAVDIATLVPHILTTFIARDRHFQQARRGRGVATVGTDCTSPSH